MRRLAFTAVIAALFGTLAGLGAMGAIVANAHGALASTAEPVPHCQPVLIVTPWRQFAVRACDSGLRDPAPGKEWAWTVDGSALKGGAVIFGSQIPRQP